jgi:hypothetical protein
MKTVIQSYKDLEMSTDPVLLRPLVERQYRPVSTEVINYVDTQIIKNCAVVFSGGQVLSTAEAYIEYNYLKNLGLSLDKSSIFVDKNNPKLISLTLSKLKPPTLVFLHSPEFSYLSLDEILTLINYYKTNTKKQIIVAVSIFNICFNRLATDIEYLEKYLKGKFINNSIVICS